MEKLGFSTLQQIMWKGKNKGGNKYEFLHEIKKTNMKLKTEAEAKSSEFKLSLS